MRAVLCAVLIVMFAPWSTGASAQPIGSPPAVPTGPACDPSLWAHVYAGMFGRPQDRLRVISECVTVTGFIDPHHPPRPEKDGDWHVRVLLDPPFTRMLNDRNLSGQFGDLVVEPVCSNPVTQRDTIEEGVCAGFNQQIYRPSMIGRHVQITGVYVTDMDHGWNEIHPVTSIIPIP